MLNKLMNRIKEKYYEFMYYITLNRYLRKIIDIKIPLTYSTFNGKFKYVSIVSVNYPEGCVTVQYSKTKSIDQPHYYSMHFRTDILSFDEINTILHKQATYNNHTTFSSARDKYFIAMYYKNKYKYYTNKIKRNNYEMV